MSTYDVVSGVRCPLAVGAARAQFGAKYGKEYVQVGPRPSTLPHPPHQPCRILLYVLDLGLLRHTPPDDAGAPCTRPWALHR